MTKKVIVFIGIFLALIGLDENISLLIEYGQLKGIEKNKVGSPNAKTIYNVKIEEGDYMEWE